MRLEEPALELTDRGKGRPRRNRPSSTTCMGCQQAIPLAGRGACRPALDHHAGVPASYLRAIRIQQADLEDIAMVKGDRYVSLATFDGYSRGRVVDLDHTRRCVHGCEYPKLEVARLWDRELLRRCATAYRQRRVDGVRS